MDVVLSGAVDFVISALGQFRRLPYPAEDCTGRVVIVTGSNVGLGREAARHFVRLNASKVILACRNLDKAETAKLDIESTTNKIGVVQVWQLDLSSFESVKQFGERVEGLDRLDILVNNASVLATKFEKCDGYESHIAVNVISTLLLSFLCLPAMRRTVVKFNVVPHLSIVSSDGAFLSSFPQRKAEDYFAALNSEKDYEGEERYLLSKLLQVMIVRKLGEAVDASGKGHIIVNGLNPGLCNTMLFRDLTSIHGLFMSFMLKLFSRSSEMGSRTLMSAAFGGEETHAKWMTNCKLHTWPGAMRGVEGERVTSEFWKQLLQVVEGIQPGVMEYI